MPLLLFMHFPPLVICIIIFHSLHAGFLFFLDVYIILTKRMPAISGGQSKEGKAGNLNNVPVSL